MRTERSPIRLDDRYGDPLVHRSWDDFGMERPPVRAVRAPLCYGHFVSWDAYKNEAPNAIVTCMRCMSLTLRAAPIGATPR
jgi:hypothetical protein